MSVYVVCKMRSSYSFSFIIGAFLLLMMGFSRPDDVLAITAPELRGQRSYQNITSDMHGKQLQQQEFLKSDLHGIDFSESDLRGTVFNNSDLHDSNLSKANLEDVVAFASRFDGADLRQTNFRNGMLLQSRFKDTLIEGADFTDAILDLPQKKSLCKVASGINLISGVSTKESLRC
uniref:Uncharacterized protein n=1 Tax=Paulinella micropora TaxID=1928728 RepID=A0A385HZK8_9EUKA|nr:hypothetical protein PMNZ_133 [Paulinella micropora]AXY63089.1 hypothetical protein PMNZ_133 [Paulinella micropora]